MSSMPTPSMATVAAASALVAAGILLYTRRRRSGHTMSAAIACLPTKAKKRGIFSFIGRSRPPDNISEIAHLG
jgi:hypothetical protein